MAPMEDSLTAMKVPITFTVKFGAEEKEFTFIRDQYFRAAHENIVKAFGIGDAEARQYDLYAGSKKLIKAARIFDVIEVCNGCVVDLVKK